MRVSRSLLTTTLFLAGLTAAQAADYLRGAMSSPQVYQGGGQSSQSFDWSGFHFGGAGEYNITKFDNQHIGQRTANSAYENLEVTGQIGPLINTVNGNTRKAGFSVFGGYSMQWDDVVIGGEVEYGRTNTAATTNFNAIARTITATGENASGHLWDIHVHGGTRKTELKDYGVARLRVGAAYGRFLPFMTLGIAVGRTTTTTGLNGSYEEYEMSAVNNANGTLIGYNRITHGYGVVNYKAKSNRTQGGFALGAGLDVALMDNVFLRGQWEYITIGTNKSTGVSMHTFKGGAAVKF